MKSFEDLVFQRHPGYTHSIFKGVVAEQATMYFDNGYGVSVILGNHDVVGFYSNGIDTYEVGVLLEGKVTEVAPYLSKEKVTDIMRKIQEL